MERYLSPLRLQLVQWEAGGARAEDSRKVKLQHGSTKAQELPPTFPNPQQFHSPPLTAPFHLSPTRAAGRVHQSDGLTGPPTYRRRLQAPATPPPAAAAASGVAPAATVAAWTPRSATTCCRRCSAFSRPPLRRPCPSSPAAGSRYSGPRRHPSASACLPPRRRPSPPCCRTTPSSPP